MKGALVAAAAVLAAVAFSVHANERSSERWFGVGETWYQHPCGLRAFEKYGQDDSPEVRRAYEITKQNPARCAEVFP